MQKNKFIFNLIILFSAFVCIDHGMFAQDCKAKQISKACKANIEKPYKYDSYAISEFIFDAKPKKVEVQFTAFQGQKYKVVFCSSGFDEGLSLNIWDKSNRVKKGRKKLYDNSMGIDNNFWSFVPPKSGNYFIEYDVAPTKDGSTKTGCVIMLIGYTEPEE
ncbi:MAG: hypothetical protein ACT4ON_11455 [Bacteroidota bacterium]